MWSTEHSRLRFIERVKNVNIPKKNKQKFIERYIKQAFKDGLTPKDIEDSYLSSYMSNKLKQDTHYLSATKITHYKNNLFLFRNRTCITVLEVPEKAQNSVDNIIYITKLKPFTNAIREKQTVKKWLLENGKHLEKIKDIKRCIVNVPKNLSYDYLMNKFPLRAINYIKNDSKFKEAIIKFNKRRNIKTKHLYYFICALLLIFPKNQILKLQNILKNKEHSIFRIIDYKEISKKQLDICYKQLYILLGGELKCKYDKFNIRDNLCYDLINDYLNNVIHTNINIVKDIFKDKS